MGNFGNLGTLINGWQGASILCIGDVMLDRFVYGSVTRISPEAPIPVLRIGHDTLMLGGAGNVVRNLSALGAGVVFSSVIGDDATGRQIAALLDTEGRVSPHLLVEPNRFTTEKTRFIAGSHQLLRADTECTTPIGDGAEQKLLAVCAEQMAACSVVVLSDYGKGLLTPALVERIIAAARAASKPVIVDPKGRDFARYRGATVLTPNCNELATVTGMPVDGDGAIVAAARHLMHTCGVESVLVTRSEDGMTLVSQDGGIWQISATAREVYDVSGAGDTVVAVLAASLAAGAPLPDAARLANAAAGIVVGKVGTAVIHPDELLHEVMDGQTLDEHAKVVTLAGAVAEVARWRRAGLRVCFTNGCFDLLHPGHISLLGQARRAGDRLIVGLNSDASIRRLKGPERPVQNELSRALVLASLASVDLVVLFEDDTPLALIEALRPDVLVKGADYTIETVVGTGVVQSYGGRVMLAELIPNQSTSRLVRKMREPR